MDNHHGAHWVLMSYFESLTIPLICKVTELINSGVIADKDYLAFAFDLCLVAYGQFKNLSEEPEVQIPTFPFGTFYRKI
jgi:hypothetical protein